MSHILAITNKSVERMRNTLSLDSSSGGLYSVNLHDSVMSEDIWVGQRAWLEQDESFKQVIPYSVIKNKEDHILVYRRTKTGGEARLHGHYSIGFGGHLDFSDVVVDRSGGIHLGASIEAACVREIKEEIGVSPSSLKLRWRGLNEVGVIIDDSTPVTRVHIGVLSTFQYTSDEEVEAAEDQIEVIGFRSVDQLKKMAKEGLFEIWSKIIIEKL
ncbi:MAG: NUDIX domain-containing protein [Methylomicrobium sp.]|nr:NUDIX domain-containing protein [Methylomicrobium sp.]